MGPPAQRTTVGRYGPVRNCHARLSSPLSAPSEGRSVTGDALSANIAIFVCKDRDGRHWHGDTATLLDAYGSTVVVRDTTKLQATGNRQGEARVNEAMRHPDRACDKYKLESGIFGSLRKIFIVVEGE